MKTKKMKLSVIAPISNCFAKKNFNLISMKAYSLLCALLFAEESNAI